MLVTLFGGQPTLAQPLRLEGIYATTGELAGRASVPGFADFLTETRNPALFRSAGRTNTAPADTATLATFALDFGWRWGQTERHGLTLGFAVHLLEADLFRAAAVDTLGALVLRASNQYFSLRGGYRYRFRAEKRIVPFVGVGLGVGLPVAARTTEVLNANSDSLALENRFFARKAAFLALRFPIGVRLKLAKYLYLLAYVEPQRLLTRVDGSASTVRLSGVHLGFYFTLRPRPDATP